MEIIEIKGAVTQTCLRNSDLPTAIHQSYKIRQVVMEITVIILIIVKYTPDNVLIGSFIVKALFSIKDWIKFW